MRSAGETGVVITMAGAGSRFALAGYTVPKYEIVVRGRTLFAWSMESLRSFIDAGCRFVFVARNHPNVEDFISAECKSLGIRNNTVLQIDALTDGQATTAMMASSRWNDMSAPVAIYNIDTYVDPAALQVSSIRGDGWIPCFPGEGDKWSFAAAGNDGRVTELREKKRISPHATVGLYWFDSFRRYEDAYQRYYSQAQNLEAREKYIAPLYNQMISDGCAVYMHSVRMDQVFPLGTPEDVKQFDRQAVEEEVTAGKS